jgi:two-component system, cell cycle sensor histidine kinase and response regulator CckA
LGHNDAVGPIDQPAPADALRAVADRIAHDLNNVVLVIAGHAALMDVDLDAAHPSREDVDAIAAAAGRAAALVDELLTVTRGPAPELEV